MAENFYQSGHFYSPIVDLEVLRENEDRIWPANPHIQGIDFNDDSHEFLLNEVFRKYMPDFNYPEHAVDDDLRYHLKNGQFPYWDGAILFCLLRHFRPKRIFEIGSGFSSLLTAEVNSRYLNDTCHFRCIEPYPRDFLTKPIAGLSELTISKVEDIPLSEFEKLGVDDILFIDSSHVSKTGSDVNYIFFHILPRLKPGVIIHVHDIFSPEDYKKEWVMEDGRSWNEQYLLQALLMYSTAFKPMFGANYSAKRFPDLVSRVQQSDFARGGGSFWMRKQTGDNGNLVAKRKTRLKPFFIAALIIIGMGTIIWLGLRQFTTPTQIAAPDFGAISNVKEKKKAFFSFVLPMVERSNDLVLQERSELNRIALAVRQGDDLTEAYAARLDELAVKYRSHAQQTPQATIDALNKRIDTIPTSLALAQAANESAWGTARFALQGNNYFGIWCWTKNCGLVPEARNAGAKHEVASFSSVQNSIDYYILMLNSHPAYAQLREIRYTLRQKNMPITGTSLSQGLLSYSERREQYVEEINAMIRINGLETRTVPGEAGD